MLYPPLTKKHIYDLFQIPNEHFLPLFKFQHRPLTAWPIINDSIMVCLMQDLRLDEEKKRIRFSFLPFAKWYRYSKSVMLIFDTLEDIDIRNHFRDGLGPNFPHHSAQHWVSVIYIYIYIYEERCIYIYRKLGWSKRPIINNLMNIREKLQHKKLRRYDIRYFFLVGLLTNKTNIISRLYLIESNYVIRIYIGCCSIIITKYRIFFGI